MSSFSKSSKGSPPAVVRIGCYSAFWGDSVAAAAQLIKHSPSSQPPLDFLTADYLAEVTMGILAKRAAKDLPGYVDEFVRLVMKPLLPTLVRNGTRVVTNAGGLDPLGLKAALEELIADLGLPGIKVAAVVGDNLLTDANIHSCCDLVPFSPTNAVGAAAVADADAIPKTKDFVSLNAYTGAFPIAAALDQGAHIVVTGRVVDSALIVGPLIHSFGWSLTDYDRLAAGSLVGHLLECGTQATGGNFTDWRMSSSTANGSPGWAFMGYPIAEVSATGDAVITKLPGTGGVVNRLSVGEQMVYEVLDPRAYLLPDVTLDMTAVTLTEVGHHRVAVRGARGMPPPPTLKVSGIVNGPYVLTAELLIAGVDAHEKAMAVGAAIVARVNKMLPTATGIKEPIEHVQIEALGSEVLFGAHAQVPASREVVLRICATHTNRMALGILAMELAPSATSMSPAITGAGAGRPTPTRQLRHISALIPKERVTAAVHLTGQSQPSQFTFASATAPKGSASNVSDPPFARPTVANPWQMLRVPLLSLAVARSGDKGDACNIGVLARSPDLYPYLIDALTAERVYSHFAHLVKGTVVRHLVPGVHGLNFILTKALGGGGLSSLRIDRQGKTYAQMLLASFTVEVPAEVVGKLGLIGKL
ncbi:hypothetical protein BC828DRAFT_380367 [Blastocladiella britannica]|nr:hypothetical protein BC828DRAFT_380367 [Blastocladiella britannica]